jgi:hypothetical protein
MATSSAVSTVKQIRAEYRVYGKKEMLYDVYCDRVVFLGYDSYIESFFTRRDVLATFDRGGVAIDRKDAEKLGFPTVGHTYIYSTKDLRKNQPTRIETN